MRKQATVVAVTVALLLALTGCGEEAPESAPVGFANTGASAETPAPLVAEETDEAEVGTDAAYLAQVRTALEGSGGNSIPDATDEQLIAAGHDACEQMLAGTDQFDVRVVENEPETGTGFKDSVRIAGSAIKHYCPEARPE